MEEASGGVARGAPPARARGVASDLRALLRGALRADSFRRLVELFPLVLIVLATLEFVLWTNWMTRGLVARPVVPVVDQELGSLDAKTVRAFAARFLLLLAVFFAPLAVWADLYDSVRQRRDPARAGHSARRRGVDRFHQDRPVEAVEVVMLAEDRVTGRRDQRAHRDAGIAELRAARRLRGAFRPSTPVRDSRRKGQIPRVRAALDAHSTGPLDNGATLALVGRSVTGARSSSALGGEIVPRAVHRALVGRRGWRRGSALVWWGLVSWTRGAT